MNSPERRNGRIVLLWSVCWGLTGVVMLMWAYAVLFLFPQTFLDLLYYVMMPLVYFGLAAILFLRRASDPQALVSGLTLVFLGPFLIAGVSTEFADYAGLNSLALALEFFATGLITYFLVTFPNGVAVPRAARWLPLLVLGLIVIPYVLLGQTRFNESGIIVYFFLTGVLAGLVTQVYRYVKVSDRVARQQAKWVVLGFIGPALTIILWLFVLSTMQVPAEGPSPLDEFAQVFVAAFLPLTLPIGITISILRYRLWDIDVIIRRTLTYGLVTGALVLIYFGSVVALQQVFSSVTGSAAQNEIVTVVSTLVIAALFVPLRNGVQHAIDRRFNRKKYDAGQIMQDFANTVRDETDLEQLTARLVQVVDETMQPKSISVWLKKEGQSETAK